jgi:hypothetical protein
MAKAGLAPRTSQRVLPAFGTAPTGSGPWSMSFGIVAILIGVVLLAPFSSKPFRDFRDRTYRVMPWMERLPGARALYGDRGQQTVLRVVGGGSLFSGFCFFFESSSIGLSPKHFAPGYGAGEWEISWLRRCRVTVLDVSGQSLSTAGRVLVTERSVAYYNSIQESDSRRCPPEDDDD